VPYAEETVIDDYAKVNTLLTYESGGPIGKSESSSPSTSKPSPSSASASTGQ
jgi:hypothetical protein